MAIEEAAVMENLLLSGVDTWMPQAHPLWAGGWQAL